MVEVAFVGLCQGSDVGSTYFAMRALVYRHHASEKIANRWNKTHNHGSKIIRPIMIWARTSRFERLNIQYLSEGLLRRTVAVAPVRRLLQFGSYIENWNIYPWLLLRQEDRWLRFSRRQVDCNSKYRDYCLPVRYEETSLQVVKRKTYLVAAAASIAVLEVSTHLIYSYDHDVILSSRSVVQAALPPLRRSKIAVVTLAIVARSLLWNNSPWILSLQLRFFLLTVDRYSFLLDDQVRALSVHTLGEDSS